MIPAWPTSMVRDLIALGRLGEGWDAIGRVLSCSPGTATTQWAKLAGFDDKMWRLEHLRAAIAVEPAPEPSPQPIPEAAPPPHFTDDPRAVRECGPPSYQPVPNRHYMSLVGCGSALAVRR